MRKSLFALLGWGLMGWGGCFPTESVSEKGISASLTPVARQAAGETSATPTPAHVPEPLFEQTSLKFPGGSLPEGVTPTADQKQRPNQALAFSGEKSKVQVPVDLSASAHPKLTITAWVRFRDDLGSTPQMQAVSQDDGDFDRGFGVDDRAGRWGWSAFGGTAGVFGGAPVKAEEWTFLAVIYDQLNKQASLLVNDQTFEVTEADLGSGQSFFWLGGNPAADEFFLGDIAHLRVDGRVLTPEQLMTIKER